MEYENGVCLCKTGRTCACVYVRVCVHAHSKWLKSFAEAEHFDIVAGRPSVLKQGPAAFMLVNCQERSVKGGPPAREGAEGVSPGGSLQRRGKLVTDLLGFEGPLCGPLQGKAAPFTRGAERGRVGLNGRRGALAPAAGSAGRTPASPVPVPRTRCSMSVRFWRKIN